MELEQIYETYFKEVCMYICSLCRDPHLSEEIAQETFSKALKAAKYYDGQKDIRAWLFTIAKNTYFSYLRKHKRVIPTELEVADSISDISLTECMEDRETAQQLHRLLHETKEPYREVFSLRVFGELSFLQIGQLFGKTDSWARVTYYRAKQQIKSRLEELEHEKRIL